MRWAASFSLGKANVDKLSMLLRILRSPRFRIIGGASLLLLAVAFVTVKCKVDQRWQEMERKASVFQGELEAERHVREPLGGTATEGLAWEAYNEASAWVQEQGGCLELRIAAQEASEMDADLRRLETRRLVGELTEALAMVQRGARCRDATHPVDWNAEKFPRPVRLSSTMMLLDVLTLSGLADIERGDVESGCAKILDGLQFGQDLAHSPQLISQMVGASQMVPWTLKRFLELEGLGALPREAIGILEVGVGKLIEQAPERVDWRGDYVLCCNFAVKGISGGEGPLGWVDSMEGFGDLTGRRLFAEAMSTLAEGMAIDEGLSASAYRQRMHDLHRQYRASDNPFLSSWGIRASAEDSLLFNRILASELRRALRRSLELPEIESTSFVGMQLIETDDGEVMTFSVEIGLDHSAELTVTY